MSMPVTAPESKHPRTATVDRAPLADAEDAHQPFVPASQDIPELTPVPLVVGALLGILFGASSMYLVLKVGLTVSASIPVAVLSITIFRAFSKVFHVRRATILENNITQTTGSAKKTFVAASSRLTCLTVTPDVGILRHSAAAASGAAAACRAARPPP